MLSPSRILMAGESPHPWEREAMKFIREALPDTDPYLAALQVDLHDPTGKRHQLDAVVLGYHALYVVEVKSHPGTLEGNHADWKVTFPDGKVTVLDNPLRATEHKSKVLGSMLDRLLPDRALRPWVEPLVFLSDRELVVRLAEPYRAGVVTPGSFARAITFGEVPLSQDRLRRNVVNRPTMRAVAEALKKVLTPSSPSLGWGELQLRRVIEEGPGFQDWRAEHGASREMGRRVRVYPIPPSATPERRDQLRRAARREADLLSFLDHRAVLKAFDYQPNGPTGAPAVAFDGFDGAETLEAFIRRNPALSFAHKVAIIEALAEGLAYCHGKRVYHRGLHPGAVLVRVRPDGTPEPKLYNFQLATRADTSLGTSHLSAFSTDPTLLYRAPEAIEQPERAGTEEADLFSLGAIAYYVLTGRHPGADLAERHKLLGERGLSVAAASDALAGRPDAEDVKSLDEVVAFATAPSPISRADSVLAWLNLFLDAASRPATPEPEAEADPLQAGKDDRLAGGLVVGALLGTGSTARVLRVSRGSEQFALKVPLSPELEDRLVAEADALRKARCDRVVPLEGEPVLAGRHCLLLGYAGDTLATLLAREGPPSLDYARRWGDDLLYALRVLEERGVLHRDVKPANLGVLAGESKKARHLFLFDFSLAGADPTRVELGTPAYRDPFLATRPNARWDASSDRYSAAVTLHELLTGALPRYGTGEAAAVATDAPVTLAAERFDAAVRDRLVAFFAKALDRDASRRHESAEDMQTHWAACFGPAESRPSAAAQPALDEAALAALPLETPVSGLPLSPAARNALDRSGLVLARELLALPRNQLSSIRGVGRGTVSEILAFVKALQAVRPEGGEPPAPVWPGYRGADAPVTDALEAGPAAALDDAGLGRIHAVAAASRDRVSRILERFPGAREALAGFLEREQKRATGTPATVEGYLDLFLPTAKGSKAPAWAKQVRAFYGLDPLPGATAGDARTIASVLGVTRQSIYVSIGRGREKWQARVEQLAALQKLVAAALAALGQAAPLAKLAEALTTALPHEPGQEADGAASCRVEALVRICAETAEEDSGPVLERVGPALWAGASAAHLQAARALGAAATELAQQDPLASAAEVERRLAEVVRGTPLADLSADRRLALAAEASELAARSARLELYPRGLSAARALQLCAGALGAEIGPEDVQRLVSSRYPEAEPLPPKPVLDALLAELKLGWNPARGRYVRADLARAPSRTEALSSRKATVVFQGGPTARERSPEVQEAEAFEATLRLAVEKRLFKVLDVNRAFAEEAAAQLEQRLHVPVRSLERELTETAWALMQEMKIDEQAVLEADRVGPEGPAWMNLVKLMQKAAGRLAPRFLAEQQPVILKDLGLAARYELDDLLAALVRGATTDGAPAILLLNAVVAEGGPQPIDAVTRPLSIPTTAPAQRLSVPAAWIQNLHRSQA